MRIAIRRQVSLRTGLSGVHCAARRAVRPDGADQFLPVAPTRQRVPPRDPIVGL
ncbi:hypothetical protein FM106_17175 [Brachybacterium faecium]|nr:hypothetical protein FM106_17175 [Brachybacterium faecium]